VKTLPIWERNSPHRVRHSGDRGTEGDALTLTQTLRLMTHFDLTYDAETELEGNLNDDTFNELHPEGGIIEGFVEMGDSVFVQVFDFAEGQVVQDAAGLYSDTLANDVRDADW